MMSAHLIQFLKRRRWSLRRSNRHPQQSRDARPATLTAWTTELDPQISRYVLPAVQLAGPGIDDLIQYLFEELAVSIHDGDGRADTWTDYVLATHNLLESVAEGEGAETREHLEHDAAKCYAALAEEFPNTVRLVLAEARLVAGQLDEAAGRIGIEAP